MLSFHRLRSLPKLQRICLVSGAAATVRKFARNTSNCVSDGLIGNTFSMLVPELDRKLLSSHKSKTVTPSAPIVKTLIEVLMFFVMLRRARTGTAGVGEQKKRGIAVVSGAKSVTGFLTTRRVGRRDSEGSRQVHRKPRLSQK